MKTKPNINFQYEKVLFLMGCMGSGKTTIGQSLANTLEYTFLDLDDTIEQHYGHPITNIVKEKGWKYFRQLETQTLKTLKLSSKTIIATGGGTPCFFDNLNWMQSQGICVYLKVSIDNLCLRLQNNTNKRPLLADKKLKPFITNLLQERSIYYEQAPYIINANCSIETSIKEVKELIFLKL